MLRRYVNKTDKPYVLTMYELLFIFVAFLGVLYLLYPNKKSLEKKVLSETANYDLTAMYLKNLITVNPKDSELVFAMAKTLYQQDKLDLSKKLLNILESNPSDAMKVKATLLHLDLNDFILQKPISQDEYSAVTQESRELLSSISHITNIDKRSEEKLYNKAISFGEKKAALTFSLDLALKHKNDKKYLVWLKNAHYLASQLGEKDVDIEVLKRLILHDKNNAYIWLNALFPQLAKGIDLKALAVELKLDDLTLANLYILNHEPLKAASVYMALLHQTVDKQEKKELLIKILTILQSHSRMDDIVSLIQKYEDSYIHDREMRQRFLQLYLLANRADLANKFSLKILHTRGLK